VEGLDASTHLGILLARREAAASAVYVAGRVPP